MPMMLTRSMLILLAVLSLSHQVVFAESYFDFDEINASKNKKTHSAAVQLYMERIYGSEVTVGPKTEVVNNSFLRNGKGKNSAIALSFDAAPITSFSVDSQVAKR